MSKRVFLYAASTDAYYLKSDHFRAPADAVEVDTKEAEAEVMRRWKANLHTEQEWDGTDVYPEWMRIRDEKEGRVWQARRSEVRQLEGV